MGEEYGPYVRLRGIRSSQLPGADATSEELAQKLSEIVRETENFIKKCNEEFGPWKSKGRVNFPNSSAPVDLFERVVSAQELAFLAKVEEGEGGGGDDGARGKTANIRPETWVLRRSVHEDAAKSGTASWSEWKKSFKEEHAQAEKEFTSSVLSARTIKSWDCSRVQVTLEDTTWEDFTLKLEESVHKMPPPLKNRVFPVLQLTAAARGRREFIVVQIAVVPGRKTKEEVRSDGALRGAYTSIERFRDSESGGGVEWVMCTASDARGVLPQWVQKMAVPGRIAKDVEMFLGWVHKERQKRPDNEA